MYFHNYQLLSFIIYYRTEASPLCGNLQATAFLSSQQLYRKQFHAPQLARVLFMCRRFAQFHLKISFFLSCIFALFENINATKSTTHINICVPIPSKMCSKVCFSKQATMIRILISYYCMINVFICVVGIE